MLCYRLLSCKSLIIYSTFYHTITTKSSPRIGTNKAIKYGLLLHALSAVFIALCPSSLSVIIGMPFIAAGASTLPVLLGYLSEKVEEHEVGSLQGAADTVRTISTMIGGPLFSRIFAALLSLISRHEGSSGSIVNSRLGRFAPSVKQLYSGGTMYICGALSLLALFIFGSIEEDRSGLEIVDSNDKKI